MTRFVLGMGLAVALCAVPAAAQAATVSAADDNSHVAITYRAGAGEANDLNVDFTAGTVFSDAGAFITAGRGCSSTASGALCPANPWLIDALLRDGDDSLRIVSYPHLANVHVSGGAGNDTATAQAISDATVEGDQGEDVVQADSDSTATADGGSGDDVVTVEPYIANGHAIGGSGDDQLFSRPVGGLASKVQMDGDTGNDVLIAHPAARTGSVLDGGTGNDVIAVRNADPLDGRGLSMIGGTGDDTLFGGALADTIDAGPGRDVIDVRDGGADNVACGDGVDVVRYDAGDSVASDCEVLFQ
jgi:Ca2+-binding RTX toxin-like protein